jgi:LytR cell envelope-related transcriptional attenuator
MASIAYALSIQHFINSVGAKAGFASIIGLALLVLLFFTQSRETANLRRRADEAEQQLYQLQLHVDHLSRHRAQQAAAPAAAQTTGAPVAAPPAAAAALARAGAVASRAVPGEPITTGAVATIPAAPAGVGAPALSSATRLIPLAEPDEISIRALRPSTNGDGGAGAVSDATVATPPPTPPPGPAPSTAAGGANGASRPPVVPMPALGTAAQATPAPRVALPRQQQRPPARPPVSPPPSRRNGARSSGRRISPVFLVLAAILLAAVVAVVLVFVTGSGSNSSPSGSSSTSAGASASNASAASKTKGAKQGKTAVTVTPSSVNVAVLNGTTTQGLAAKVLGKLTDAGYKGGTTQNATESGLTSTIVGYTSPTARDDALAVAKSLNLSQSAVRAVSQGDRVKICGSSTTACTTQVIVTLGADLAQTG